MIKNMNSFPEVYYGLHFAAGVAEYSEAGKDPYRILLEEDTIKNMNPTFQGKPVYVEHVDSVDLENIQNEADGYVIDSFWNPIDGKCWCKFIVVSERGKQAIKSGWKLSNAYAPKTFSKGGLWHGVEFAQEVTGGEYEHLAIVQNPRYEESVILTPELFKKYNEQKDSELKKLANSKDSPKGESKMNLNFFKRTKVENSVDLESTVVQLPKSKKELTIAEAVTELDKVYNMHGYASADHMVKVGENEMSVGDLVKKHVAACNEIESMKKSAVSEEGGEPGKGADDEEMNSAESVAEDSGIVGDRGGDKSLSNEDDEEEMKKKEAKKNEIKKKVASLKNAGPKNEAEVPVVELSGEKLARGKARYGSN